jgi:hypothetical protein
MKNDLMKSLVWAFLILCVVFLIALFTLIGVLMFG